MATTKIWSIKGWLGHVVAYVEKPEKTINAEIYKTEQYKRDELENLDDIIEIAMSEKGRPNDLSSVLGYAMNGEKTHSKQLVSGVGCDPDEARSQMLEVQNNFRKSGGIIAHHAVQSFKSGEITPETAHEIGVRLASELWGDRFQALVATHTDQKHVHNHFVLNSVSYLDGMKYNGSKKTYYAFRNKSDGLCSEYGLSVIKECSIGGGKSKHYAEWRAEKDNLPTWRSIIKDDIDRIIAMSISEKQFFINLKKHGYTYKIGKDISVTPRGKERGFRLMRNLGDNYSAERIRERILEQEVSRRRVETTASKRQIALKGSFSKAKKVTGIKALYFHYLYKMGVYPKKKTSKYVPIYLKEDVLKLKKIAKQTNLISKYDLNTLGEVSSLKSDKTSQIDKFISDRKALYTMKRRKLPENEMKEVLSGISAMSKKIKTLREEVKICSEIEEQSKSMTTKLSILRNEIGNDNTKKSAENTR